MFNIQYRYKATLHVADAKKIPQRKELLHLQILLNIAKNTIVVRWTYIKLGNL